MMRSLSTLVLVVFILSFGGKGKVHAQEPTTAGIQADIQLIISATHKFNAKDYAGAKADYEKVTAKFKTYTLQAETQKEGIKAKVGTDKPKEATFTNQTNVDQDLISATQLFHQAKTEVQKNSFTTAYVPAWQSLIGFKICLAEMHYSVAMSKYHLKDYAGAMENLDQALTANDEYVDAYIQRGWIRQHIRDTDLNESYNDFSTAISLDPKNTLARYHRGQLLFNLQMDRDAVKELDKAIEINPKYAEAINLRGMVKLVLCMEDTMMIYPGCEDIKRAAALGLDLAKQKYQDFCSTPQKRMENQQKAWQQGENERAKKRREEELLKQGQH